MIPYKIIYSRRRTIQITVSGFNEIIVRCPFHTSKSNIERFLNEKQDWIDKVTSRNYERQQKIDRILKFRAVYVDGKQVPLILGDKNYITPTCVYLKSLEYIQEQFIKNFSQAFFDEVNFISEKTGLIPLSVKVRNYKSRWGCCDIKGNIFFNYKLFMLPLNLRKYVIIHELCHIKHHNHSSAFWSLVEHYLPNWKSLRKELKNYDFLTILY